MLKIAVLADAGFDPRNVLTMTVSLPETRYHARYRRRTTTVRLKPDTTY